MIVPISACEAKATACDEQADGLVAKLMCKGQAAVCEGSCPATCAVQTGQEAVSDLAPLVSRRK